ncbi:MAG: DUF3488 and transglutaminase-like domain-containing protein [Acidimicrobiales bacterium]
MSGRRPHDAAGLVGVGAEAALVAVHVVVALSFVRVFDDRSFVGPLLAFVLVAHASAIAVRRLAIPVVIGALVALAGAAITAGLALFPETTTFGLPTGETLSAARVALADARAAYPEVVAPTPALAGFVLAAGIALWTAIWFADWTAHRLRAGIEAITPAAAIFAFCAVLGSGQHTVATAVAFGTASMAFLALQRAANARREQSWSPESVPATRAALRAAGAIGVVALLAGSLGATHLPGAGQPAAIDWRGSEGRRARVTVSPLVELRRRLVEQSDVTVFRVQATQPAYWRLTALDRFDGEVWASDGEFRRADDDLPRLGEATGSDRVTQTFEIDALAAIWVPAAYEAASVQHSPVGLRWDEGSSTLIVDGDEATSNGLTYTIVSQVPIPEPDQLSGANGPDPDDIVRRYEALPEDFPGYVRRLAANATEGARTRYEKAIALQRFFREEFEYSTTVDAGHSDDALIEFLQDRVGYCEQFSGAYAAMARSLGIPARVAVGFTPGEPDPTSPGSYIVRGRHAHAWPEVYFPDIGWVAFEPTPGRGMPGAEGYTGVAASQDPAGDAGAVDAPTTAPTTTTPASGTTTTGATGTSEPSRPLDQRTAPATTDTTSDAPDRSGWWIGATVAALAVALAVAAARRRRRRHRGPVLTGPAERGWREALALLAGAGLRPARPRRPRARLLARLQAADAEASTGTIRDVRGATAALADLADLVGEERWSSPAERGAADGNVVQTAVDRCLGDLRQAIGRPGDAALAGASASGDAG